MEVLTSQQCAALINWTDGSLRVARSQGAAHRLKNQPPYTKKGRAVIYDKAEVLAWMKTAHYVKGERS